MALETLMAWVNSNPAEAAVRQWHQEVTKAVVTPMFNFVGQYADNHYYRSYQIAGNVQC